MCAKDEKTLLKLINNIHVWKKNGKRKEQN